MHVYEHGLCTARCVRCAHWHGAGQQRLSMGLEHDITCTLAQHAEHGPHGHPEIK